jgi:hypothetical protein
MSAAVGADIEALCSKCGDVWHVVVAKNQDGSIAKVQCKQCGGYHRYRSNSATKPAKREAGTRTTKRKETRAPVQRFETPQVAADTTRPIRQYSATERYAVGDRVEHPSFGGQGVVEVVEIAKITVFFPSGRRVLVHAKSASGGLERPKPFDHSSPLAAGKAVPQPMRPDSPNSAIEKSDED